MAVGRAVRGGVNVGQNRGRWCLCWEKKKHKNKLKNKQTVTRHTNLETHTIIHIYSHIITESFDLRAQQNSLLFKKGD